MIKNLNRIIAFNNSILSERGDYEQALRILSGLHDAQKISMQETAQPQNVSIDLSTQPDRPPSNLNSVFACA